MTRLNVTAPTAGHSRAGRSLRPAARRLDVSTCPPCARPRSLCQPGPSCLPQSAPDWPPGECGWLRLLVRLLAATWPAFAVLLLSGIWNIAAEGDDNDGGNQSVLMVKLSVVAISGVTVYLHSHVENPPLTRPVRRSDASVGGSRPALWGAAARLTVRMGGVRRRVPVWRDVVPAQHSSGAAMVVRPAASGGPVLHQDLTGWGGRVRALTQVLPALLVQAW